MEIIVQHTGLINLQNADVLHIGTKTHNRCIDWIQEKMRSKLMNKL